MITAKQRMLDLERQLSKIKSDLDILVTDLYHTRTLAQRKESELCILRLEVERHGEEVSMSDVLERHPYLNHNRSC